ARPLEPAAAAKPQSSAIPTSPPPRATPPAGTPAASPAIPPAPAKTPTPPPPRRPAAHNALTASARHEPRTRARREPFPALIQGVPSLVAVPAPSLSPPLANPRVAGGAGPPPRSTGGPGSACTYLGAHPGASQASSQ